VLHYGDVIGCLGSIGLLRIGETIKSDYPLSQRLPLFNVY
jgi:hypothetical protein